MDTCIIHWMSVIISLLVGVLVPILIWRFLHDGVIRDCGQNCRLLHTYSDSSSDSECSSQSITSNKKTKKKQNQFTAEILVQDIYIKVIKTPGLIDLHGPMANTVGYTIFCKTKKELLYCKEKNGPESIYQYLHCRLRRITRKRDMDAMKYIQGNLAARYITGDSQQSLRNYKNLLKEIHKYDLRDPHIMISALYNIMFDLYMEKNKLGKAYSSIEASVWCIRGCSASTWTAWVYYTRGDMQDKLIQLRPKYKKACRGRALDCFLTAREHFLLQQYGYEDPDFFLFPILYTIRMIHVLLDVPTLVTIRDFPNSCIVYDRLLASPVAVSWSNISDAENMLTEIIKKKIQLTTDCERTIDEKILICSILINIRALQLHAEVERYDLAVEYLNRNVNLYQDWCEHSSKFCGLSEFKNLPHLVHDLKLTLDKLQQDLNIIIDIRDNVNSDLLHVKNKTKTTVITSSSNAMKKIWDQEQQDRSDFTISSDDSDSFSGKNGNVSSDVM